jgi:hypothetical protein
MRFFLLHPVGTRPAFRMVEDDVRTKLYSKAVILISAIAMGCGGKTNESSPYEAQSGDEVVSDSATGGGPNAVAPAGAASTQKSEPVTDVFAVPDSEGTATDEGAGGAGTTTADAPPGVPPQCSGRMTTLVKVVANLDSDASAINTAAIVGPPAVPANAWNPQDPPNTANFSTTITIYDSLGIGHSLEIYFRKSDTEKNAWDFHLLVPGAAVVARTPDRNFELGRGGSLKFTSSGALSAVSGAAATVTFRDTVVSQTITFDFGARVGPRGTSNGLTSIPAPCSVFSQEQNGMAATGDSSCDGVQP